ncbi:hypothetical protein [Cesiribacter sp. SM1]|uniref:hypothetical protein n=1 Tax=Cesiribacter sp. SM1 TaxID=2861196 RepID=UPI001CD5225C|nr:hypothetical protein [Cesiribacter sp. SM1]
MEKEVFSRKELYDLVWSTPVLTLSKKYKVSESSLRKLCRRHKIPLPPAGHWRKVERNKRILVTPLPSNTKDVKEIILKLRATGELEKKANNQAQYENLRDSLPLKVPSRLTNPDPLIIAAKDSLTSGKGRRYQHGGLVWTAGGQLDIRVSPKSVGRALRFMDTFIKLLRARGHDINIIHGSTCAVIGKQTIEIQLKEFMRLAYVEHRSSYSDSAWTSREYQATGKLALRVDRYPVKEWKDAKLPLEEQLWPILMKLEAETERMSVEQAKHEKLRLEEQEKLRIERELREQKEKELAALKELLDQAQRWQQAKALREYLDAVEVKAAANAGLTIEQANWLMWARWKSNELDPLLP